MDVSQAGRGDLSAVVTNRREAVGIALSCTTEFMQTQLHWDAVVPTLNC
jgi:hypothetical protein